MDFMSFILDNKLPLFFILVALILLSCSIITAAKFSEKLSDEEKKEIAKKLINGFRVFNISTSVLKALLSTLLILPEITKKENKEKEPLKKEIDTYLIEEYMSSKKIRAIFINLFVVFTISVIGGFIWLDRLELGVRITIGCIYFGFSLFVLFIIKSCYSRSAVIISIMEDMSKKDSISNFLMNYKKEEPLSESDVSLMKIITTSRAEREKPAKHPYEIILKNIQGSSVSIGKNKIDIGESKKDEKK